MDCGIVLSKTVLLFLSLVFWVRNLSQCRSDIVSLRKSFEITFPMIVDERAARG